MDETKIKVDTRISEEDYAKVLRIAVEKYDGNKSLALRMLVKKGIQVIISSEMNKTTYKIKMHFVSSGDGRSYNPHDKITAYEYWSLTPDERDYVEVIKEESIVK